MSLRSMEFPKILLDMKLLSPKKGQMSHITMLTSFVNITIDKANRNRLSFRQAEIFSHTTEKSRNTRNVIEVLWNYLYYVHIS